MPDLATRVRAALGVARHGVAVLFRDKHNTARECVQSASELRHITTEAQVPLLVSGRVDIALAVAADGVHLTSDGMLASDVHRLMPGALVGRSCHNRDELRTAEEEQVDYVTLSPIWEVPNKGPSLGLTQLRELISATTVPVLALGGVGPTSALDCLAHHAHGVAVMRGVLGATNPEAAMGSFCAFLDLAAADDGP